MFVRVLVLIYFAISPAVSAVPKDRIYSCSENEFSCSDGTCISATFVCDEDKDCSDGSDEAACSSKPKSSNVTEDIVLNRYRRQSTQCRKYQWQCRDGTCIPADGECDGVVNCPDKSDETHALCRKIKCHKNLFRCTYGACVDGTAPCNGSAECADMSDELLPRCRNETNVGRSLFRCEDGSTIPAVDRCDGVPNCLDGSDETVRACAAKTCPLHLFQCAYGACVDKNVDCNGQNDCADGSDEADELCNKMLPSGNTVPLSNKPLLSGNCELPPYPEHGTYIVTNAPQATPGQRLHLIHMEVSCNPGYRVLGNSSFFCYEGSWSQTLPIYCVRFCKLEKHPSVNYECVVYDKDIESRRTCNDYEPSGTSVSAQCDKTNYYSATTTGYMTCNDGVWVNPPICIPECGRVTPESVDLIIDGWQAQRGELPWHVGIYRKKAGSYEQICGGSLVSDIIVISAAHCFWNTVTKRLTPSNYAVAIGKLYRDWDHEKDKDAQKSFVKDIKIPPRFQGSDANFQQDIAVVILETSIIYKTYIRPVCLDFGERYGVGFEDRQLRSGNKGKVAGWGLTAADGNASEILKVVELPYVDIEECIANSPLTFKENITGDKICAGYSNGTALCRGDSGGGLSFLDKEHGKERYYLRGIVSTAPKDEHLCNANTLTAFTQIVQHERFLKKYL